MSLLSLRKSTPSAEPSQVTVDNFIEEALYYASGASRFSGEMKNCALLLNHPAATSANGSMRRATFTLDHQTIDTLARLSKQTDISRSRLIRIWAAEQAQRDGENLLCANTV